MYMKSLVSLAVLGAMSAVATAGDLVVFDKPNESYTVDGLNKYGATIKASDITITNTTYNGIDAYGVFDLNAANDISIQGATNGIFTPSDHQNSSIKITTPKKLTITGPWAIHAEGKGTITIDAGDLVLRGSNGIAANSTGTVSIDAQTVDIASTNKYGVHEAELDAFGVEGLHPDGKRSDPGEPDIKVGAELPDGLLELAPVRFAVRAQPLRSAVLLSENGIGHRVMERIEFVIAHDGERRTRLDHAAHDFKRAADFGPAVDEVAEKDHTATFWMPQDAVRLLITHALEENRQFRGVPVHVADDVKA